MIKHALWAIQGHATLEIIHLLDQGIHGALGLDVKFLAKLHLPSVAFALHLLLQVLWWSEITRKLVPK